MLRSLPCHVVIIASQAVDKSPILHPTTLTHSPQPTNLKNTTADLCPASQANLSLLGRFSVSLTPQPSLSLSPVVLCPSHNSLFNSWYLSPSIKDSLKPLSSIYALCPSSGHLASLGPCMSYLMSSDSLSIRWN